MDKNANPLDHIIRCCEQGLIPHHFDILNAKDELKRIRQKINNFVIVGWSRINDRGDLYDPRFCFNPHIDQNTIVPLYFDKESFHKFNNEKYSK